MLPKWGRFTNCDAEIKSEQNKYNLYMYCKNNPVKYIDNNGVSATAIVGFLGKLAGAAIGAWKTISSLVEAAICL